MVKFRAFLCIILTFGIIPSLFCMETEELSGKKPALIAAVKNQDINLINQLIAAGAPVNEQDSSGRTALHWAIVKLDVGFPAPPPMMQVPILYQYMQEMHRNKMRRIILILLNAGADITLKDQNGKTVLEIIEAADYNYTVMELLNRAYILATGLSCPFWITGYRKPITPFEKLRDLILRPPHTQLSSLLQECKCINEQDDLGATLLMYAAARGEVETVKLLLDYGASPYFTTYNEQNIITILQHIIDTNWGGDKHKEVLKLLENKVIKQPWKALIMIGERTKRPLPAEIISKIQQHQFEPAGKPAERAQPSMLALLAGGPAGAGAAAAAGLGNQPILFNRKKLIATIGSTLAAVSYGIHYLSSMVPTGLKGDELENKLVTALTNRDYYYADQLAQKNLQAVQELDAAAQQNIKALIEQAELDIINETVQTTSSLNPFKPSASMQLQYLANLLRLIEQPKATSI